MILYADLEYYTDEYLCGRVGIIPPAEFEFWARKAAERINPNKVKLDTVPDYLKQCVCEVAEAYFMSAEKKIMSMFPSERVGDFSRNATQTDAKQLEQGTESEIRSIILRLLGGTELHNNFVCRGVR